MRWIFLGLSALLVISGYAFLFTGLSRQFQLQQEINSKLPASVQCEPLFWSFGTWQEFRRLEAEYLPGTAGTRNIRLLSIVGARDADYSKSRQFFPTPISTSNGTSSGCTFSI